MGKDLNGKDLGKGISQRKDGRYIARFTNRFGKRVENNDVKLAVVKKWLRDAQYEDEHGLAGNGDNLTVDAWFEVWANSYKKDVVAQSTYKNYCNSYKNHVQPTIGKMLLKNVKPLHCKSILNGLYDAAFSFGTANLCRITMHAIFDGAIENNYIMENPVNKSVKCKQREVPERRVLTIEEQKIFTEYSKDNVYYNAFQLVLQTGLRCGEVGALKWSDIDFENRTLKVRRTLLSDKDKGGLYFGSPKTKTSNRVLPLTDIAIELLKAQKMQLFKMQSKCKKWNNSDNQFKDLVFKTTYGNPTAQSNYSSALIRIVNKINADRMIESRLEEKEFKEFAPMHFHSLRHTYATRAVENGVKPKSLQKLLGHSNIGTTMNIYVHVTDDELKKEAEKINLTNFNNDDSVISIGAKLVQSAK